MDSGGDFGEIVSFKKKYFDLFKKWLIERSTKKNIKAVMAALSIKENININQ
jgi:hypothetical protein